MSRATVNRVLQGNESFRFLAEPGLFAEIEDDEERWQAIADHNRKLAEFVTDFTPPLYNVWTFAKKTNKTSHFGNSEQRIVVKA